MTFTFDATTVRESLDLGKLIEAVEQLHIELAAGRAVQPARHPLAVPDSPAVIIPMIAASTVSDLVCFKLLIDNPANDAARQRSTIVAMRIDTGECVATLQGAVVTQLRTAAASAVATRALARSDARVLGLVGAGALAQSHLRAIAAVRDLDEVVVWNRTPRNAQRIVDEAAALGLSCVVAEDVRALVERSDIICTLTPSREPIVRGAWLRPGQHVNAVGSHHARTTGRSTRRCCAGPPSSSTPGTWRSPSRARWPWPSRRTRSPRRTCGPSSGRSCSRDRSSARRWRSPCSTRSACRSRTWPPSPRCCPRPVARSRESSMDHLAGAYSRCMTKGPKTNDPRRDVIANQLREAIISGRFKAGERLVEDALAEEHGVSRVPVREALRRLETEGFVTLTPYRGATVSTGSGRDSLELMQVRRGLEVMAARLAAEIRGGVVAGQLAAVVERGREAAHSHQVKALPPLIMEFHELVAHASGNRELRLAIDRVLQRVSWGFELDFEERIDSAWTDHAAIAAAILNNSPIQAGYLMDEHIAKDERIYRQKLDRATD